MTTVTFKIPNNIFPTYEKLLEEVEHHLGRAVVRSIQEVIEEEAPLKATKKSQKHREFVEEGFRLYVKQEMAKGVRPLTTTEVLSYRRYYLMAWAVAQELLNALS